MTFGEELEQSYLEFESAGAEKIAIGKTVLGDTIYSFAVGCGAPKIIVQYGIHAREYITFYLAKRQILDTIKGLEAGCGTVYFVPVVNIDGVRLVLDGLQAISPEFHPLLNSLCQDGDFSQFKANIRGVDLNVNFDAKWGTGLLNEFEPRQANFVGEFPHSEPEVLALVNFTTKIQPDLTISYHSKGEVIYYGFFEPLRARRTHRKFAKIVQKTTGYRIIRTKNSAGGYKDWCINKLKIPALTIEVGAENLVHPITKEFLPDIYQKNAKVIFNLLDYLRVILYN